MTLNELTDYAKHYIHKHLPISFNEDHYTKTIIHKNEVLEIAVGCFAPNQMGSIHNHDGNCVIKVIEGKIVEQRFCDSGADVEFLNNRTLNKGDITKLDGFVTHQFYAGKEGAILLSFCSPRSNLIQ